MAGSSTVIDRETDHVPSRAFEQSDGIKKLSLVVWVSVRSLGIRNLGQLEVDSV